MQDAFGVEHGEVAKAARWIKDAARVAAKDGSASGPLRLRLNAYNWGRVNGGPRDLSNINERGAESARALRTMRGQRAAGTKVGEGIDTARIDALPGQPRPLGKKPPRPAPSRSL